MARLTAEEGDPFAGAATQHPQPAAAHQTTVTTTIEGCLDNLALAVTNDATVTGQLADKQDDIASNFAGMSVSMDALSKSLERVTTENVTLRQENNSLRKQVGKPTTPAAPTVPKVGQPPIARTPLAKTGPKEGFTIKWNPGMGNPNFWKRGAICHTHGYGTTHDSMTCKDPGTNHKTEATRANPMGACTDNKGWDA